MIVVANKNWISCLAVCPTVRLTVWCAVCLVPLCCASAVTRTAGCLSRNEWFNAKLNRRSTSQEALDSRHNKKKVQYNLKRIKYAAVRDPPPHPTVLTSVTPWMGGGQRLATRPIEKSNKLIWDFAFISFSFFGIPFFFLVCFFWKVIRKNVRQAIWIFDASPL